MKLTPWAALLLAFPAYDLRAQTAPLYDKEAVVIEHRDTLYRYAADGTGSSQTTVVARLQSDAALKELGILSIAFASRSQHVEFAYVRARHADGTLSSTPTDDAVEIASPVTQQAPFYSDLKIMQLPVRSLRIGDTLEWQANIVTTKPEAPGQFWGQESFVTGTVVLAQSLELHTPKGAYLKTFSPGTKAVESDSATEHIYRWENHQPKPTVGKAADDEREAKKKTPLTPEQELDATEGKLPDVAWTTFKSWEDVGAWYRGLEAERSLPDAAVKARVAEITAGQTTQEEKVQAVYAYVSTHIRYIGVAFGIGRYQPHPAAIVLENQYGDCKDKHTLLAAMLTTLGLHPEAVLIGAGIRFNPDLPSPASFNHLITRVPVDGKPIFLDSTAEVAPYRMLLYAIRDHQALDIPDTGPATLVRTPADPPFPVLQTMDAAGSLDKDGVSISRITFTFRGDDEIALRAAYRQATPAQYDAFTQQLSQGIGYSGTVSHAVVANLDDTSKPLTLSYDYKRDQGGDWPNRRIVAQLVPITLFRPDVKNPPIQSIALGVPRVESSTASMKLPVGWGVELPEAVHKKSPYATYDLTFRFDLGVLTSTRRIEILKAKVLLSDWKTYSTFAESVDLGMESYITLTGATGSGTPTPLKADDGDFNLTRMMDEVTTDATNDRIPQARALLDQIKTKAPQTPHLWSMYGYLEFRSGNTTEAITDMRKELAAHPDDLKLYPFLVYWLTLAEQKEQAEVALNQWIAADPENPLPVTQLMAYQTAALKQPARAVTIGETAAAKSPDTFNTSEPFQIQLGRSQLAAGQKDKARTTLTAILHATQSPNTLNDVAYELADASLELPLDESSARTALDKLTEQTKAWTLDENMRTLQVNTSLIEAAWDTMGWILFREGKTAEAENYIRAAWNVRPLTPIAEHLAEIALSHGDKNAALGDYELAQATVANYDNNGVHTTNPESTKLTAITDGLRKEGAHTTVPDAHNAIEASRKFPLGPANNWNGTAEYRLLLSARGIEKAEPTGDKKAPNGEILLKKAKLSALFPTGSDARLVHLGLLNCHQNICELVLYR